MSFLIQKPVLIAVRFMSITRSSVSVCINIAMCHGHFTLVCLIYLGVVLLCLSFMPVHPPCAAQVRSPFPTSLPLLFSYSFFISFISLPPFRAIEQSPFTTLFFFSLPDELLCSFFLGWIIKRRSLKALSHQVNICILSFFLINLLYFIPWNTYRYFQHPPLLVMLICPFISVTLMVSS